MLSEPKVVSIFMKSQNLFQERLLKRWSEVLSLWTRNWTSDVDFFSFLDFVALTNVYGRRVWSWKKMCATEMKHPDLSHQTECERFFLFSSFLIDFLFSH